MTKFNAGDRVEYISGFSHAREQFNRGPLLGTVVDPTEKYDGYNISRVVWDTDVYPQHNRREDMMLDSLRLVEPAKVGSPAGRGSVTKDEVKALREKAVRGTLVPGLYRYVYGGDSLLSYEDIVVTKVGDEKYDYYVVGNTIYPEVLNGYLSDAGVLPYRPARTETCNLGHEHEVEAHYNVNFMVPLTVTV